MTDAEHAKEYGVSRQTWQVWKRKGWVIPEGSLTRNRRGKPSPSSYRLVNQSISKQIPKWKSFELNCRADGENPVEVLELLLSRCQSQGTGTNTDFYHDPDFFAAALWLAIERGPGFTRNLFKRRDATCPEAQVAALVREGHYEIISLGKKHPREAWAAAKEHVFIGLDVGAWRYNCNPRIDKSCRLIMRPRWPNNRLSPETIDWLRDNGLLHSTNIGEAFVRYPWWNECIAEVGILWNDPSTHEETRNALRQFRHLSFKGNRVIFDGEPQRAALQWLREKLKPRGGYALKFAEAWARRYRGRLTTRPTRKLVNAIFYTSGRLPTPGLESLAPRTGKRRRSGGGWKGPSDKGYGQPGLAGDADAYGDDSGAYFDPSYTGSAYEDNAPLSDIDWTNRSMKRGMRTSAGKSPK